MYVDISSMLFKPDVVVEFCATEEVGRIDCGGEIIEFTQPVQISGTCSHAGENIRVAGTICGSYRGVCARCMGEVTAEAEIPFEEEFGKKVDEENPDRYLYEAEKLDLSQMLEDLLLLNIPTRHLCRPDCKGLCPVCGADRNIIQCDCQPEQSETRKPLGMLAEMINHNNEEV